MNYVFNLREVFAFFINSCINFVICKDGLSCTFILKVCVLLSLHQVN